jgi:hypothetical protein
MADVRQMLLNATSVTQELYGLANVAHEEVYMPVRVHWLV